MLYNQDIYFVIEVWTRDYYYSYTPLPRYICRDYYYSYSPLPRYTCKLMHRRKMLTCRCIKHSAYEKPCAFKFCMQHLLLQIVAERRKYTCTCTAIPIILSNHVHKTRYFYRISFRDNWDHTVGSTMWKYQRILIVPRQTIITWKRPILC